MGKDRVAIWIKKAALEVEKLSNQVLAPFELTHTQYKILMMLYHSPEQFIRQRDIEKKFSMTNPSVTGIVQNLEKKGLVIRLQSQEDKRSKLIYPTEHARKLEPELSQLGKSLENQVTANLQEEECRQLCELLKKMLDND